MRVNIALLTVTDTRTLKNDKSGSILVQKIEKAKHNFQAKGLDDLNMRRDSYPRRR